MQLTSMRCSDRSRPHDAVRHRDLRHGAARALPAVGLVAGTRPGAGLVGLGLSDRRLLGRDLERGRIDFAAAAVGHRQYAGVRRLRHDLERRAAVPRPPRSLGVDAGRRDRVVRRLLLSGIRAIDRGAHRAELADHRVDLHLPHRRRAVARAPQDLAAALAGDLRADPAWRGLPAADSAGQPAAGRGRDGQPRRADGSPSSCSKLMLYVVGTAFIVLVLAKERSVRVLRDAASIDELTGLLNRRGFFAAAHHLVHRQAKRREPVSVLMFDLDHFKSLNDRFGHPVGDEVLRTFAATAVVDACAPPTWSAASAARNSWRCCPAISPMPGSRPSACGWRFRRPPAWSPGRRWTQRSASAWRQAASMSPALIASADVALYRAKAQRPQSGRRRRAWLRRDCRRRWRRRRAVDHARLGLASANGQASASRRCRTGRIDRRRAKKNGRSEERPLPFLSASTTERRYAE